MAIIGNNCELKKLLEYKCVKCDYITHDKSNFKKHHLTRKHQSAMSGNKYEREKLLAYKCEICDYKTGKLHNLMRHLATPSHQTSQKTTDSNCHNEPDKTSVLHVCQNCNKQYKTSSGIWRHQKKCTTAVQNNEIPPNEVITMIMQENSKIHLAMQQQSKTIQELIPKIGNNNNNTQTNHQTNNFNINMFLNETCKDAMDISDFTKNIDIGLENVMYAYDNNVLSSSRNLMMKSLQNMEVEKRPMHCTDAKRNVMYIKNNGEWKKDVDNQILKGELENVSFRHIKGMKLWEKANPMYESSTAGMERYLHVLRANSAYVTNMPGEMKHTIKMLCTETYVSKNSMGISLC